MRTSGIPFSVRRHLPEYMGVRLQPLRDAHLVVPRVMERGDLGATRWMLRRYGAARLRRLFALHGRRLSPRTAAFWSWWLGVRRPPLRPLHGLPRWQG